MSILTGPEILRRIGDGSIEVDPFDPKLINPASLDVRLGGLVRWLGRYRGDGSVIDPKCSNDGYVFPAMERGSRFTIEPGCLYLMHTEEVVYARDLAVMIDGKSSIGRLGVSIHQTAGYVDPGFRGQITLEVTSVYKTALFVGMRIGQLRFETLVGDVVAYAGNYQGDAARGAASSRSHLQFKDDP